jgi:hypothetical protein
VHLSTGLFVQVAHLSTGVVVQFPHLATILFVTCANLLPQRPHDRVVAGPDLGAYGRKLTAHLIAQLRNLRCEVVDAGRQFLENRHALFEPFYTLFNRLRLHPELRSGAATRNAGAQRPGPVANRVPKRDDDATIVGDSVQYQLVVTCRFRK